MTHRERKLLHLLVAVAALAAIAVGSIQIFGGRIGDRCADSYSCRGFLVGGAECVSVDGAAYCTVYCRADAGCPPGWRCLAAHPTVLTVETSASGKVCIRDR
jgi:hypothetical protein